MNSTRPGKEESFRNILKCPRLYLPILAVLVAFAASGCGSTSEGPAGASASVNQCAFQPLPATDATHPLYDRLI